MKIINTIKINFYSFLFRITKPINKYFGLKFINSVIKDVRDNSAKSDLAKGYKSKKEKNEKS